MSRQGYYQRPPSASSSAISSGSQPHFGQPKARKASDSSNTIYERHQDRTFDAIDHTNPKNFRGVSPQLYTPPVEARQHSFSIVYEKQPTTQVFNDQRSPFKHQTKVSASKAIPQPYALEKSLILATPKKQYTDVMPKKAGFDQKTATSNKQSLLLFERSTGKSAKQLCQPQQVENFCINYDRSNSPISKQTLKTPTRYQDKENNLSPYRKQLQLASGNKKNEFPLTSLIETKQQRRENSSEWKPEIIDNTSRRSSGVAKKAELHRGGVKQKSKEMLLIEELENEGQWKNKWMARQGQMLRHSLEIALLTSDEKEDQDFIKQREQERAQEVQCFSFSGEKSTSERIEKPHREEATSTVQHNYQKDTQRSKSRNLTQVESSVSRLTSTKLVQFYKQVLGKVRKDFHVKHTNE